MTVETLVEYDKPRVEEQTNEKVSGIFEKIVGYEFLNHSESVPGSNQNRSSLKTTFSIRNEKDSVKTLNFNGYIGSELIGQEVGYEELIRVKTIIFDPKNLRDNPLNRKGVKNIEKICKLIPKQDGLPIYTSKETSQYSI